MTDVFFSVCVSTDPDITDGDGVYSRYLPMLRGGPGHYQLSVTVDHNNNLAQMPVKDSVIRQSRVYSEAGKLTCCGSKIKYDHLKLVQPFQRHAIYGVLEVVSPLPPTDMVPPSRILDLRASVNRTTREVALRWTAPGDDNDWGRADHYEAVLATSWAEAKAFDGERVSGMPLPVQVGTQQAVFFYTDHYEQIIYVAIRAVDKVNNRGGVSNIATLWVPQPPTTPPPITSTHTVQPTGDLSELQGRQITQPVSVAGMNLEDIAVIVGSVGGFLIIAAVLATFCYCHVARRRTHHHKQDNEKLEGNHNIMIKTNSNLLINQDESQDSVDSNTNKENEAVTLAKDGRPLSPIQSWGVTKLLQEHERRVSMTSGPLEAAGSLAHYQNIQEPFPDVTLTGSHPYGGSQTPSTTHSDPPAYQPPYVPYPYAYHPGYSHEDLPPYTPPGLPSQSSQVPTAYTHEMASQPSQVPTAYTHEIVPQSSQAPNTYTHEMTSQPSELSYPVDPPGYPQQAEMQPQPSFVGEMAYPQAQQQQQPPLYSPCPEDPATTPPTSQALPIRSKVPPPVAPKPPMAVRVAANAAAATNATCVEPKRRNVTQV